MEQRPEPGEEISRWSSFWFKEEILLGWATRASAIAFGGNKEKYTIGPNLQKYCQPRNRGWLTLEL